VRGDARGGGTDGAAAGAGFCGGAAAASEWTRTVSPARAASLPSSLPMKTGACVAQLLQFLDELWKRSAAGHPAHSQHVAPARLRVGPDLA
jgi:hypothetical protein